MKLYHFTLFLMACFPFAISGCHATGLSVCTVNKRELIGPTVLDTGTLSRIRPNQRGRLILPVVHNYAFRHFVSPFRFAISFRQFVSPFRFASSFRQFVSPVRFVSPNTLSPYDMLRSPKLLLAMGAAVDVCANQKGVDMLWLVCRQCS